MIFSTSNLQERLRPKTPLTIKIITLLAFMALYVPLIIMIIYSFIVTSPDDVSSFTIDWYLKVFQNIEILRALGLSLLIAFMATIVSTVLGTLGAVALVKYKFYGKKFLEVLNFIPLVIPELVLGISFLIWFVFLHFTLGLLSITLSHITFSVSYVVITVIARFEDYDKALEEAARDLGASPIQVFFKITLPLISPAIFSGALMAFTLSFDDFLITYFTAGFNTDTLPLKLYAMIKFGMSREINALSTLVLIITFILVFITFYPKKQKR